MKKLLTNGYNRYILLVGLIPTYLVGVITFKKEG